MKSMKLFLGGSVVGLLGLAALAAVPRVYAADVYWSIGVQSGPTSAVVVPSRPMYPPPPAMPSVVVSPGYVVPVARWDDRRARRDGHHNQQRHHWHEHRHERGNDRRMADVTCYHQDVGYFDCRRGVR